MRPLAFTLAVLALAGAAACSCRSSGRSTRVTTPDEPTSARIRNALVHITPELLERHVRALPGPRHHRSSPQALLSATEHVRAHFQREGLEVREFPVTHDGFTAPVIIGRKPGTSDGSVKVLVIAHFDTVPDSPGADDNTSGVAGLMAMATALSRVDVNASVELLAVPFEEEGLVGSRAFASALSVGEREALQAVFALEMIGYVNAGKGTQHYPPGLGLLFPGRRFPDTADFIAAFGERVRPLPVEALEAARPFVPDLPVETLLLPAPVAKMQDMRRSDHAPFWDLELPAAFVGDTANFRSPHYHRESDTPETLDFTFAARTTQWVTAAVLLLVGVTEG